MVFIKPDQVLLLPMHREDGHPGSESHDQVPAVTRFEGAALLSKPALELLARHHVHHTTDLLRLQQICCITSLGLD